MVKEFLTGSCGKCGGTGKQVNPEWLKARRLAAGRTLKDMGDVTGFSAAFLCDVEFGRRNISPAVHDAYLALKVSK